MLENRLLFATVGMAGATLLFILLDQMVDYGVPPVPPVPQQTRAPDTSSFLIDTPGCKIPFHRPMEPAIRRYIYKENYPDCTHRGSKTPIVYSDMELLNINETAVAHRNWSLSDLECCWKEFNRKDPALGQRDSQVWESGDCVMMKKSQTIRKEFVHVNCSLNKTVVYQDYFYFVPKDTFTMPKTKRKYSVLVVGIDSLSRLNFHRQMPLTAAFLRDNMSAVEMLGFNKVADNTFQNLIPALTGLSERQLKGSCWSGTSQSRFDACRFLWNDFKASHYVTAYGEDAASMGLFNYNRGGFSHQPTDFWWRTFTARAESKIGWKMRMSAKLCLGLRPTFTSLLGYISKFVQTFSQKLFFGFFRSVSLSHEFLNLPGVADRDYLKFFSDLTSKGMLKDTVVVLMSDHGIRWGGIRSTYQGRLEERLPLMMISLPDSFRLQFPQQTANLLVNAKRLTTHFDFHETMLDLALPDRDKRGTGNGISLFDEVPEKRTCKSAHVSDQWCTCKASQSLQVNIPLVRAAAYYILGYINSLIRPLKECALLKLIEIEKADVEWPSDSFGGSDKIEDYTVIIRTQPGGGLFEATVRKVGLGLDFLMTGAVSRINLYGTQSHCINDFKMKLYCYCL